MLRLSPLSMAGFILLVSTAHAATTRQWNSDSGIWNDAKSWGGTLPAAQDYAEIHHHGSVTVNDGTVVAGRVDIGAGKGDKSALTVNGGSLMALEFVRMGEYPGSSGKLVLNGGRLCTTEIGVGGMNEGSGPVPSSTGELEVHGGSVLTRYLMIGWPIGSTGRLHIVGSKADSIVALNSVDFCIPSGPVGSTTELNVDLDAGGVTPITLHNKQGRVELHRKDRAGKCFLHIHLLEVPPNGDIPLLRSELPCTGTFQDLPEGSAVRAEHDGKIYEWTITYAGGPKKADVVLTDPQLVSADGTKTSHRSGKSARVTAFDSRSIKEAFEEMYHQMDLDAPPEGSGQLAFPGAEGHGAHAKGGRGGKVLFVTNLNDSGPGSLREAIGTKGPRTVIFRVGGIIELRSLLDVREPYLTIAGQTSPGDGICLKGANDTLRLMNTHDIIVRYLRVRTGYTGDGERNEGDCISCYSADNFIVDHCSTSWGTDETLSCTQTCDRYTIQWCIIAEGLNYYGHSMGSILGGDRSSWHHNFYAHCGTRNPRFAGLCRCDFRNNVIYDWKSAAGYGDLREVNYVNNYLRPGPSSSQKPPRFIQGESVPLAGAVFMQGNVLDGSPEATQDNRLGTGFDPEIFSSAAHAAPPVTTQPAEAAYNLVLQKVGTSFPKRDATDDRLVNDVKNHSGKVIGYEKEVGGWTSYAGGPSPVDSDNDGIPDDWEKAHGLNPNDPNDANQVAPDGYTNLEHYLNGLVK